MNNFKNGPQPYFPWGRFSIGHEKESAKIGKMEVASLETTISSGSAASLSNAHSARKNFNLAKNSLLLAFPIEAVHF
jgi:hypothetical protein